MIDTYGKIVLTIIAFSMCVLAIQNTVRQAATTAQVCGGSKWNPCYIQVTSIDGGIEVNGTVNIDGSRER